MTTLAVFVSYSGKSFQFFIGLRDNRHGVQPTVGQSFEHFRLCWGEANLSDGVQDLGNRDVLHLFKESLQAQTKPGVTSLTFLSVVPGQKASRQSIMKMGLCDQGEHLDSDTVSVESANVLAHFSDFSCGKFSIFVEISSDDLPNILNYGLRSSAFLKLSPFGMSVQKYFASCLNLPKVGR